MARLLIAEWINCWIILQGRKIECSVIVTVQCVVVKVKSPETLPKNGTEIEKVLCSGVPSSFPLYCRIRSAAWLNNISALPENGTVNG